MALLEVSKVVAGYGQTEILHGVVADRGGGRDSHDYRAQRLRQVDPDEDRGGVGEGIGGERELPSDRDFLHAAGVDSEDRTLLRAPDEKTCFLP